MIRTAYPLPPSPFWRHFELTARRTRQALSRRRGVLRQDADFLKPTQLVSEQTVPDTRDLQARCTAFTDQYETLIDVLCAAAHHGSSSELEAKYIYCRTWLARHYGEVKGHVGVFLPTAPARPTFVEDAPRFLSHPAPDAFETLFLPATLTRLLEADNGSLIDRLMDTQTALDQWTHSLARV